MLKAVCARVYDKVVLSIATIIRNCIGKAIRFVKRPKHIYYSRVCLKVPHVIVGYYYVVVFSSISNDDQHMSTRPIFFNVFFFVANQINIFARKKEKIKSLYLLLIKSIVWRWFEIEYAFIWSLVPTPWYLFLNVNSNKKDINVMIDDTKEQCICGHKLTPNRCVWLKGTQCLFYTCFVVDEKFIQSCFFIVSFYILIQKKKKKKRIQPMATNAHLIGKFTYFEEIVTSFYVSVAPRCVHFKLRLKTNPQQVSRLVCHYNWI